MDELVTHHDVMQWLPGDIRHTLTMALSPDQRGWWTADEAEADGGRFVEVTRMCDSESRFLRVGD